MSAALRSAEAAPSANPEARPHADRLGHGEVAFAALIFAGMCLLRWWAVRTHSWNSDEPQHLHIVWAWASGLLPYRDVFDNHGPLFAWLCSPLFRWLGERADIIEPMRLALAPLYFVSLACI